MAGERFVLNADGMARIASVVETVEATQPNRASPRPGTGPRITTAPVQVVKVTSLTATDDLYPAVLRFFDNATKTFSDGVVVWLISPNPDDAFELKSYLARRTGDHPDDKKPIFIAVSGGGETGTLARLTAKTYTPSQFINYTWEFVDDSASPLPVTYTLDEVGAIPLYEINDTDVPVPRVAYIRFGGGDYYLFAAEPQWEFVRKTGPAVGGYFPGELLYYDQVGKVLAVTRSDIKIIDVNA
jgi:hypothetical protein